MEHVPPLCIFPEHKDSRNRADLRRNLIRVPSCSRHNNAKSGDDTYLMMVLVSYVETNQAARDQIRSKVARAWARDRRLAGTVVKNLRSIDPSSDPLHGYQIDTQRFNRALTYVAHGLHFHTYGTRAETPYRIISYPIVQLEHAHANDVNQLRGSILSMADELDVTTPRIGDNEDIFWFQLSRQHGARQVMRMCFFGAFMVVAIS